MAGISLVQAQEQLNAWLAANLAVASNQSYSMGNRSLTRADAGEIRDQIEFWQTKVQTLSVAPSQRPRTRYVVRA